MEGERNDNLNSDREVANASGAEYPNVVTDSDGSSDILNISRIIFRLLRKPETRTTSLETFNTRALVTQDSRAIQNVMSSKVKVLVVLVEAKGLPVPQEKGDSHKIHCKLQLGKHKKKSKDVPNTPDPKWGQQFEFTMEGDTSLELSVWAKHKITNHMGRASINLSNLEMEKTHEFHHRLDNNYGAIHFTVTLCKVKMEVQSYEIHQYQPMFDQAKAVDSLLDPSLVGQLHVKLHGARGVSKEKVYCHIELENEKVETHRVLSSEPVWNRTYLFNIYDITANLDLTLYKGNGSFMGQVSIPLLNIKNGESQWFGLKDISNTKSANGKYARVQLEMTIKWNPIKAIPKLFQPKRVKYTAKPPVFDTFLVYSNLKFIQDTFQALVDLNENYKRFLEWESQELSFMVLLGWLLFWYFFKPWLIPLLLILPFLYFWAAHSPQQERTCVTGPYPRLDMRPTDDSNSSKNDDIDNPYVQLLTGPMKVKDMTLNITRGVEYTVCLTERLYNLASFKVPFLSYLTMFLLLGAALVIYCVPFNYIVMLFGICKFSRKYLNPDRILNNDMLDFISRVPDNETLKTLKMIEIPEPSTCSNLNSIQQ